MTTHVELRRGAYHDSVSLMQVSRAVAGTPGVTAAQVAMATELNVDVLRGMGFDVPAEAGPNDLVVALRTETTDAVERRSGRGRRRPRRPAGDHGLGRGRRRRRAAHAGLGRRPRGRDARRHLGPRPARGHRGLRRDRVRAVGDAVLRQRVRRGRGPAQGRRRRGRRARHGPRLRHGARRRGRPGLRERRAPRLGGPRRGLRHRRPAGDVPARRGGGRVSALPRRRRPRPQGRRRRPLHAAGAAGAGRRPGDRARRRRVEAAGRRRARRGRGVCRASWACASTGPCSARAAPTSPPSVEAFLEAEGHAGARVAGDRGARTSRASPTRPRAARAVLRRHPRRRGDDGRRGRAGRHPQQHRARPRRCASGPTCATTATSSSTSATTGSPAGAPTR